MLRLLQNLCEECSKEYPQFDFNDKNGNATVNARVNLTLLVYKVQPFNYSQTGDQISFIAPEMEAENGAKGAKGASITFITHDGAASEQENVLTYTETVRSLPTPGSSAASRRGPDRLFWVCSAVRWAIGGSERTADLARR